MRLFIIIFAFFWCLIWAFLSANNSHKINFYVAINCYLIQFWCCGIWLKRFINELQNKK